MFWYQILWTDKINQIVKEWWEEKSTDKKRDIWCYGMGTYCLAVNGTASLVLVDDVAADASLAKHLQGADEKWNMRLVRLRHRKKRFNPKSALSVLCYVRLILSLTLSFTSLLQYALSLPKVQPAMASHLHQGHLIVVIAINQAHLTFSDTIRLTKQGYLFSWTSL